MGDIPSVLVGNPLRLLEELDRPGGVSIVAEFF